MQKDNQRWLPSMEAAVRYGVSPDMLRQWWRWRNFPIEAVRRDGNVCEWDVVAIEEWLRSRPLPKVGRPVRWATLVGHPDAKEFEFDGGGRSVSVAKFRFRVAEMIGAPSRKGPARQLKNTWR